MRGAWPLRDFRRRDASSARTEREWPPSPPSKRLGTRAVGSRRPGAMTHQPARCALAVIERARPMTGHKWASSKRAGVARRKLPIIFFMCA